MENDTLTAESLFGSIPPIKGCDLDHVFIQPKHEAVELPKEVGEELKYYQQLNDTTLMDYIAGIADFVNDAINSAHWVRENGSTDINWDEKVGLLVDAWRYGWEAEPEAKWYVQTPKEWWEDKSKPEYIDLDSMGISDGLKCKEYAAQFTRDELKKYRLDNDIFTLVPVGKLK